MLLHESGSGGRTFALLRPDLVSKQVLAIVSTAPNPVTADELATMKQELENAGADLVVPRASEEEGFQIAVEKA